MVKFDKKDFEQWVNKPETQVWLKELFIKLDKEMTKPSLNNNFNFKQY